MITQPQTKKLLKLLPVFDKISQQNLLVRVVADILPYEAMAYANKGNYERMSVSSSGWDTMGNKLTLSIRWLPFNMTGNQVEMVEPEEVVAEPLDTLYMWTRRCPYKKEGISVRCTETKSVMNGEQTTYCIYLDEEPIILWTATSIINSKANEVHFELTFYPDYLMADPEDQGFVTSTSAKKDLDIQFKRANRVIAKLFAPLTRGDKIINPVLAELGVYAFKSVGVLANILVSEYQVNDTDLRDSKFSIDFCINYEYNRPQSYSVKVIQESIYAAVLKARELGVEVAHRDRVANGYYEINFRYEDQVLRLIFNNVKERDGEYSLHCMIGVNGVDEFGKTSIGKRLKWK